MHVEENVDDPIENHLSSSSFILEVVSMDSPFPQAAQTGKNCHPNYLFRLLTHKSSLNLHRPTVHNVQNTITSYLPRPVGASRRTLINQQVLKTIVKEYYLFSIVEDKEIVKLLIMLNPRITYHYLKNELLKVIKEWGLENRISACISENASNISKVIYANGGMYTVLLIV
ncbi:zinc finger BED domain-containing protein 1-like [Aphis craccivora]|uniref:Zinc finger BED domain-containing protein 1-like n=1 Tax=Aphis craccivora TaxID=307492 RepID=A0A6G0Z793_APHCR|nr:zinc finger BED domain-containing protein 1-like [Aphis craccivora]